MGMRTSSCRLVKGVLGLIVVLHTIRYPYYFSNPESSSDINFEGADDGMKTHGIIKDEKTLDEVATLFFTNSTNSDDNVIHDNTSGIGTNTNTHDQKEESWWWWKDYVEQTSVVFQPSNNTDWCVEGTPIQQGIQNTVDDSIKTGMYLVKIPKAGSSTAAGVSLQIAKAMAAKKGFAEDETCPYHVSHGSSYVHRKQPYFLWTTIREPAKRAISQYFFRQVTRKGIPYNSENLINEMHKDKRNYQLKYIGLQEDTGRPLYSPPLEATKPQVMEMVHTILNSYHFIAVTERMDESLVVMKLLFNFPDEAMVVLSSKRAGGFDDGKLKNKCYKIQSSYTTPEVDEYIATDFHKDNWDYYLYAAINRSLDRTIDMLGRDRVEREVARHKELEQLAVEKCHDTAIFPCTEDGARPNQRAEKSCFFGDVGCGHECVQEVIQDHVSRTGARIPPPPPPRQ